MSSRPRRRCRSSHWWCLVFLSDVTPTRSTPTSRISGRRPLFLRSHPICRSSARSPPRPARSEWLSRFVLGRLVPCFPRTPGTTSRLRRGEGGERRGKIPSPLFFFPRRGVGFFFFATQRVTFRLRLA